MKKLMIAALTAAMIGGAYAEAEEIEFVYDFTASVKSTGGKAGKKVTYTVNCGRDEGGEWWWAAAGFESDAEAKAAVKKMDNEEKAALAETLGFDGKETAYNVKNQKGGWCTTFKYTDVGSCYRAAKSYKIKDQVLTDCCGTSWSNADLKDDETCVIDVDLLNFFGAQDPAKATKIEMYAAVTGIYTDGRAYEAAIAGQGSASAKLYKLDGETYAGISSISGNIVGQMEPPTCETCCNDGTEALAFTCDDDGLQEGLNTAIFGSFSLKFNKKATNKYYK